MKKFLLLSGAVAISLSAMADALAPKVLSDAWFVAVSPNGTYAASALYGTVNIYDLSTGAVNTYGEESGTFSLGIGKCVSDNGIVLGSTDDVSADYWKDGEWYSLSVPENAVSVNLANAITPDGSRICGSIGVGGISFDGDALMQAPCIWNATADGYSEAVMLPYPEVDLSGRVPMYITAVDMSDDGKLIIGQVQNATGMMSYPILYTENADGEWSYKIVHEELLNPGGVEFPAYPGEGPAWVDPVSFMTPEELAEYDLAVKECEESGYSIPYPELIDYMSSDELTAYNEAVEAYEEEYAIWYEQWEAWMDLLSEVLEAAPVYEFNSVRMSPDGKTFGCTVSVPGENDDPFGWGPGAGSNNVWVFDVATDAITKYDQNDDLNLTYMCNDGVAMAANSTGSASVGFVLKNGEMTTLIDWMTANAPAYAEWIKENMTFEVEVYEMNEETGDWESEVTEVLMTGRPVATPDLSVILTTLENTFDWSEEGEIWMSRGYVFNISEAGAVDVVTPASSENTIYDLSGRKLRNAEVPGIYIINGEKKVVR